MRGGEGGWRRIVVRHDAVPDDQEQAQHDSTIRAHVVQDWLFLR